MPAGRHEVSWDGTAEDGTVAEARRKNPSLPKTWQARAIRYQRKGFPPRTLLTSLLDPIQYPAAELVALYHERWEEEGAFDEIKTHLCDCTQVNRPVLFRSQTPVQ